MDDEMAQQLGLMQGKRGVVLGVANNRSIAWGIAKACHAAGAQIALTWQGDALKKRVEPLAKELDGLLLGHCDVTEAATIDAVFDVLKQQWGKIDFVVHAIAFSDKDQLDGRYIETTADNFTKTMLISCYSLTAIAQRAGNIDASRIAVLACLHLADRQRTIERELAALKSSIHDKSRHFSMLLDRAIE